MKAKRMTTGNANAPAGETAIDSYANVPELQETHAKKPVQTTSKHPTVL
jgi:hypothetical protein